MPFESNRTAILSAPGSRGDVNPLVAIGRKLKESGFRVLISLAEPYADLAEQAGLEPIVLFSQQEFDAQLADANVWKPISGAKTVLKWVMDNFLRPHLDVIHQYHVEHQTVLVSHPLDFASRVFRDLHSSTPLIDVHLAPAILRLPHAPSKLTPWPLEIRRPAWAVKAMYWLADSLAIDPVVLPELNRLRLELGLPTVRRALDQWWLSPDRILAMYPEWFAPESKIYAPRLIHAGFPLQDFGDPAAASQTPGQPFVFTGGTANHHCRQFFRRAAKACETIGHPGLLLSTHADNFPPKLPENVRTASFVPLGHLLPQCAAIVHHGGVGTTSQALACGVPQVIRPLAFDQFDHAERIEKLGVGRWLRSDHSLETVLRSCLAGEFSDSCVAVAEKVSHNAIHTACDQIIQDLRQSQRTVGNVH